MSHPKPSLNPWPIGIVAAFVLFIAATAGLIAFTALHRDDLVTSDYYEQEIRYQHQLDRLNRTQHLLPDITVAFDGAQRCIRITLPAQHAHGTTDGRIHLYRPSGSALDQELKLQLDAQGTQTLDAEQLQPGLWKVRIHWSAESQEYFVEKIVVVPPRVT